MEKEPCSYFLKLSSGCICHAADSFCTCDGNKWYCDHVSDRKYADKHGVSDVEDEEDFPCTDCGKESCICDLTYEREKNDREV